MTDRKSNGITIIDIINAKSSKAFKDVSETINIKGAAINTDKKDGKQYGYIWDESGICYAGNSASIKEAIDAIIDLLDEGAALSADIVHSTSKQGKEFLTLQLSQR